MNSKIIGFTISPQPIDHSDVDLFVSGLTITHEQHGGYHLYLWGIGDLSSCRRTNRISLSFPLTFSLDDRNVVIRLGKHTITIANDWLGSIPVFFNPTTQVVSTLFGKVAEGSNTVVHPEGLANYLDFGFPVFGQTPLADINFMRYYSVLRLTGSSLTVSNKADPVDPTSTKTSTPHDVLSLLQSYIRRAEQKVTGDLIIPTSGGFDSRTLNVMTSDKNRIRSFTYGVSRNQAQSDEVVKAKRLSRILGTSWQQIELSDALQYWPNWHKLYGGVHLHGMYHIEFFKKIREKLGSKPHTLLSGIIGDAWGGLVTIPKIQSTKDLEHLAYAHGIMVASRRALHQYPRLALREQYLQDTKSSLRFSSFRVIAAMRIKLILLDYLISLPDYFGFPSWTPFLNRHNVEAMMSLPDTDKQDRNWQRRYFATKGVDLESLDLEFTQENLSDAVLLWNHAIPPLRPAVLRPYIRPEVVATVNRRYKRLLGSKLYYKILHQLLGVRVVGPTLVALNLESKEYLVPYNQLIVLKSLEQTLEQQS